MMSRPGDCFAVSSPWNPASPKAGGYRSLYLSLFGRDLKAGQAAEARCRLIIRRDLSDEQAVRRYEAYLKEADHSATNPEKKPLKLKGIEVDVPKREVRMDAAVCLDEGILEYLVCLEGTFEHETVFSTKCRPSQLHLALLMTGLVPHPFKPGGDWWHRARARERSRVGIEVEFEQDGEKRRCSVAEFLVSRENDDGVVLDRWVFTGSVLFDHEGKSRYAADYSGIVVGIIPEGSGVIQYGERAGVPYQGDDQGMEVNARTVPAAGAKVKLVFTPHDEKRKPVKQPRQ
jgi:hypothetical protein